VTSTTPFPPPRWKKEVLPRHRGGGKPFEPLTPYLPTFARAYECAFKRDLAFVRNIETAFHRPGGITGYSTGAVERGSKPQTILILTGGFHGANLEKLLTDKGYNYISILPKFEGSPEESPYFRILQGEMLEEEKVIREAIESLSGDTLKLQRGTGLSSARNPSRNNKLAIASMSSKLRRRFGIDLDEIPGADITDLSRRLRAGTAGGGVFVIEFYRGPMTLVITFTRDAYGNYRTEYEYASPRSKLMPIERQGDKHVHMVRIPLPESRISISLGTPGEEGDMPELPEEPLKPKRAPIGAGLGIMPFNRGLERGGDAHVAVGALGGILGTIRVVGAVAFGVSKAIYC
jgi:hypothetical protein